MQLCFAADDSNPECLLQFKGVARMYDRAPRNLTTLNGSTAEHVGPGTYDGGVAGSQQKQLRGGMSFFVFCFFCQGSWPQT